MGIVVAAKRADNTFTLTLFSRSQKEFPEIISFEIVGGDGHLFLSKTHFQFILFWSSPRFI